MRARQITAIVLAIIAVPVIFFGLIDPLEGGIALLLAAGIGVAVRLLSRVPFPKLTWISMVTTVAIGVLVLALAILTPPVEGPGRLGIGIVVLLWVYRVGVVVTLAGAVLYVVRLIQAARKPHDSVGAIAAN